MPVWLSRLVHTQVVCTTQLLGLRQVQLSSWVSLYDLLPATHHCDDEIFFNAYLLRIFLWPNDMPTISIRYAKETCLSLLRDNKSTGIGYLSTIRFCEWEEKETRKTQICDVSYSSQWQREKDGLRQEKYAQETSCCHSDSLHWIPGPATLHCVCCEYCAHMKHAHKTLLQSCICLASNSCIP